MYHTGRGVAQDFLVAARWYRIAADKGNASAQENLGILYEAGKGVEKDDHLAVLLYLKAANQGSVKSQFRLGVMSEDGRGTPQDNSQAEKWYRKAAEQGHQLAKENLDRLLAKIAAAASPPSSVETIALKSSGGTFNVPVYVNGILTLDFTIDSGAADVSIPAGTVATMVRLGTLKESDFTGTQTYVLADGSKVKSRTFIIRSMKIGNVVLENVEGSEASKNGGFLLGQSFLKRFESWSIDNKRGVLVLN